MQLDLDFEHLLLAGSLLMVMSVLLSQASSRVGIPSLLLFLGVGMLAGSDGPGGIHFDDPEVVELLGMTSLIVILYAGGFDTRWNAVRPALGRAVSLATLGVALSVGVFATIGVYAGGMPWPQALLLGSIVSSTDAAAVFGVLRTRKEPLKGRVGEILEFESGANDPMAVFLTMALIQMAQTNHVPSPIEFILGFGFQMGVGAVMGIGFGWAIGRLLGLSLSVPGLRPTLSIALALLTFSTTAVAGGSGFLAVYVAGIIVGNMPFPERDDLNSFHDGLAWLAQVVMFLALGLLVFPSRLVPLIPTGVVVALAVIFVVRPIAVFISLAFSASNFREKLFVSWAGLRGAVPIMLATLLLVDRMPLADEAFHLVFFVVLFSVLLQGTTIPIAARWLRL